MSSSDEDDESLCNDFENLNVNAANEAKQDNVPATLDHVAERIKESKQILVVVGAGISVSCGIPDFRSADGLYARIKRDHPDIGNPQKIFDIGYLKRDPKLFFRFAKDIFVPGEQQYKPSTTHRFLAELMKHDKLLRVYSQNIDGLEKIAGLSPDRFVACHGSMETCTCTRCGLHVDSTVIAEHIKLSTVPYCKETNKDGRECNGIIKPDVVFFGEPLPGRFHRLIGEDAEVADLVLVMGTSLEVYPVAGIPSSVNKKVARFNINRQSNKNFRFDAQLIGDCDIVCAHLRKALLWDPDPLWLHNGIDLPAVTTEAGNRIIFHDFENEIDNK